jgi:hypothetical protein
VVQGVAIPIGQQLGGVALLSHPGKLGLFPLVTNVAFADTPAPNPFSLMSSFSPTKRAEGISLILKDIDPWEQMIVTDLVDDNTHITVTWAIITALHSHFYNAMLLYPRPKELAFMTVLAYERIILDGFDQSSIIGVHSRQFLNNTRDERVEVAFNVVGKNFIREDDPTHKSCIALFNLEVLSNFAFLIIRDAPKSGQSITPDLLKTVDGLMKKAYMLRQNLNDGDKLQGARLDYLVGVIDGSIATYPELTVSPDINKLQLLQASIDAFQKFVDTPGVAGKDYRYPFQISVARKFLEKREAAVLKSAGGATLPGQGCTEPSSGY